MIHELLELLAGPEWQEVRKLGATFLGFAATAAIWSGESEQHQVEDGTRFIRGLVAGPVAGIGAYFVWPFFAFLIGALVLMISVRIIGPRVVGTAIDTRHAIGHVISKKSSRQRDRIANTPQDVIEDGRNHGLSDKELIEQIQYLENARNDR